MTGQRDGYELRTATAADLDQVADLVAARGEPADALDLRLVVDDPSEGLESCLVVMDGGRVVSTATLLRETVRIGTVDLPAGQVELVATAEGHEGRGLVRALMDEAHRRSAARGDVLQVMVGIPYFYRQFGYGYAAPIPRRRRLEAEVPPADPAISVRQAGPDDIPAMARLQEAEQAGVDVAMPHSAGCWHWLVAREGSRQWVAERAGAVVATARVTPPDEDLVVAELAGDADGVRAIVGTAAASGEATVQERPFTAAGAVVEELVVPVAGPDALPDWYYVRVPDLAALVARLAPALVARLDAAGLAGERHDVLLSSWRSHVRFTIGPDGVEGVTGGGPEQAPVSKGGSGIPPDALGALLVGPDGALGLEERLPDAWLGRQRDLMAVLFPPQRADLLTYYLAI